MTTTAHRRWVEANPEKYRESQRRSSRKRAEQLNREMIASYGGRCSCCGENDPRFLTLEHIGGRTGVEHRTTHHELTRLKRLGWPDTCTCYCYNCNLGSARNGGVCPHKENDDGVFEKVPSTEGF